MEKNNSAERIKILEMLSQGKITAVEANELLKSIEGVEAVGSPAPKFLRVQVLSQSTAGKNETVNVRVPLQLLRSGIKLASLMPSGVQDQVNRALQEQGLQFDLGKIKTEDLEALVSGLAEMTVDVDQGTQKVQIFCE